MTTGDKRDWFSVQMMPVPPGSPWSFFAAELGDGEVSVYPVDLLVLEHARPPFDGTDVCYARIRARCLEVDGTSMDVQDWDAFLAFGCTHALAKEAGEYLVANRAAPETKP